MRKPAVLRTLLILSACSGLLALYVFITGGGEFAVGTWPVRVRRPWTPLWVCFGSGGLALWLGGTATLAPKLLAAWDARDKAAAWIAAAAALAILATGLAKGAFVATGADGYGYVSQGERWARGSVVSDNPMALTSPWPLANWTFSPLGYRPALTPGLTVPTYSAGLPLVMAAFIKAFGRQSLFWVVPLLGALAVWSTYLWGRSSFGALTGAIGALLLACSPIFLYQLAQPMSDVPVTACWITALALVVRGRFLGAGTAAGLALLTRPNLAPLGACVALAAVFEAHRRARSVRGTAAGTIEFGLPFGLAFVFTLAVNQTLYGNPLLSGYGPNASLFSLSFIPANIEWYSRWMWDYQTPFIFLALASPVVAWLVTRAAARGADRRPEPAWSGVVVGLGSSASVVACYLVYVPFDTWPYLRFLMPALPLLLVLATWVAVQLFSRAAAEWRAALVAMGAVAMLVTYIQIAKATPAFTLHESEQRYVRAANFVGTHLPPRSVVITVQHCGSLRYYADVLTLRWDWLEPDWLDRAVSHLQRAGYHPYFLIERWEEDSFRGRFSPASELGRLDWPPLADIRDSVNGRIYDPAARSAFRRGQAIDAFIVRPNGIVAQSRAAHSLFRD